MIIDCHAHLADGCFESDIEQVLARAFENGVHGVVCVSENITQCRRILKLARRFRGGGQVGEEICDAARHCAVYPCAGLHPVQMDSDNPFGRCVKKSELDPVLDFIRENHEMLVGVGEVGLDFRPCIVGKESDEEGRELRERQRDIFREQVRLAKELNLTVNVHSRSAGHHALKILEEEGMMHSSLLHAFDGKAKYAVEGAAKGFMFSIPPAVLREQNGAGFKKLAGLVPMKSLCIETDSPALAAINGSRNEPCYADQSRDAIAECQKISPNTVAEQAYANTLKLFPKIRNSLQKVVASCPK
eukprot:Nk52_evm1s2044 gene=Nk52_evmTU1s2044